MASKNFTFICGGDDFLVARMGKVFFEEKARYLDNDFSKEVVNGMANNVSEVEAVITQLREAVQTLPLIRNKKVVWFKGVNFLADSVTGRAEGTLRQLEPLQQILTGIDAATVDLIISASPVDRRRSFAKWCEKKADFQFVGEEKKGEGAFHRLLEKECRALGVKISGEAREFLMAKLSGNTRLAIEELHKLATYLGEEGGTIDENHVAELVPNFGEGDFFEAVEAFYALDLEWTLNAIRRHFFVQKEARGLITTLQGRNRLMIQLRVLLDTGEIRGSNRALRQSALEKAGLTYSRYFGGNTNKSNFNVFTQNPWYLGRLATAAGNLPLRKLIDFQIEFFLAFEEILYHPTEQEQVMRDLAVRCLKKEKGGSPLKIGSL